jgi:translation initiation factor IF-1
VDEGDTVLGVLPESVVRSLDLRHGDVVRILERDDRGRLKVQLLERAETDESNRVELKFCLVSMRNEEGRSFLAIDEMLVGGEKKRISLPGSKESYLEIKEEDIRFFKLEVGDVVDVAYWVNRPNTFRVIWKYRHVQAG